MESSCRDSVVVGGTPAATEHSRTIPCRWPFPSGSSAVVSVTDRCRSPCSASPYSSRHPALESPFSGPLFPGRLLDQIVDVPRFQSGHDRRGRTRGVSPDTEGWAPPNPRPTPPIRSPIPRSPHPWLPSRTADPAAPQRTCFASSLGNRARVLLGRSDQNTRLRPRPLRPPRPRPVRSSSGP